MRLDESLQKFRFVRELTHFFLAGERDPSVIPTPSSVP
jgi:hypothetical protein